MKKLLFLLLPLFINAQDVAIGQWKDYLSYNSASYICEEDEKIYCVASGGLYYVNKEDMTINRMSKITGLSDVGIKQVAYSETLDITIITYENCNIDLLKNNHIVNISDIKRKEIPGLKTINNITINSGIAYLSSSFGLVLVDLEKIKNYDSKIKLDAIISKSGVAKSLEKETTIANDENNLTFEYSSNIYQKYYPTNYQYRLLGKQEEWSSWKEYPFVKFENLNFGNYTFQVRSKIGEQVSEIITSP